MSNKIKELILNKKVVIFSVFSFFIPFIVYLMTLERKLVGGDTSWYALEIPKMQIFVPTGYPTFSLLGKLITYLPIGDLAYRLNLFSAIFGALTILFLFLSINKLIKNELISIISSLILAFIFPFWNVANRLEFDTLNSFFIILLIFSAILYNENKERKYLYFFFFCLGLSLTNHPIAFFIVPAIILYIIIINPKIFKSLKAIFISILFFILPLLSYFYLLIRSLQGYGEVTSFQKLFYYVTGRGVSGKLHGGHFTGRTFPEVFEVFKDYLNIIYENYGIVLIIIAVAGFVFLIKRNIKFGICSFLLIIFNFIVPPLYLSHANPNYLIDSMLIIAFYIACGFLLILNTSVFLFNKSLREKKILKIDNFLKYFLVVILFLFFTFYPISFIYANYGRADLSEPEDVYKFWDEAFGNMEENSKIYVRAESTNRHVC
jgi:4-amino-4-deoxy-L-arabinose transferase-like glycosyltransferase